MMLASILALLLVAFSFYLYLPLIFSFRLIWAFIILNSHPSPISYFSLIIQCFQGLTRDIKYKLFSITNEQMWNVHASCIFKVDSDEKKVNSDEKQENKRLFYAENMRNKHVLNMEKTAIILLHLHLQNMIHIEEIFLKH